MNRRTFLAAVAPIAALAAPASSQAQIGAESAARLNPGAGSRLAPTSADKDGDKAPRRAKGPTEITAREGMLDNKAQQAVFSGEVEVKDPEFHIVCDKLTIFLKRTKGKPAEAKPAEPAAIGAEPAEAPAPQKKGDADAASGIDRAIAEGNVIITQDKPDASGKPQRYTATAKRAVYDNSDGVLTLYSWPRVSQSIGGNMSKQIIAIEESCIITLNRNGSISYRNGRARTTLQSDDAKPNASR